MNIFDAIKQYDSLMSRIEELGGEITPELATELAITEEGLSDKIRSYYYVIKGKEAEISLAKDEITRLRDVITVKENLIKRLKTVVCSALDVFGISTEKGTKKLNLGDLTVWQKKTEALNLEDGLDDPRFCQKKVSLTLSYNEAKSILNILSNPVIVDFKPIPDVQIVVIKDKLKQWLLDNEKEHNALRDMLKEEVNRPSVDFENTPGTGSSFMKLSADGETPVSFTKADLDVLKYANIQHNTTVIFK